MDGFQNILLRGLGLASAWRPTAILLAYAAGFFVLAVWRIQSPARTGWRMGRARSPARTADTESRPYGG